MWEKIWNLEKPDNPLNQYPNNKSEFLIHINDKQFKVKKNPNFKPKVQPECDPIKEEDPNL